MIESMDLDSLLLNHLNARVKGIEPEPTIYGGRLPTSCLYISYKLSHSPITNLEKKNCSTSGISLSNFKHHIINDRVRFDCFITDPFNIL